MTTKQILYWTLTLFLTTFWACEKPVDNCEDDIETSTTEPILISYFDALEQILYYAEEHWDAVVASAHLVEVSATGGGRYLGYTQAGEQQLYEIALISVSQAELGGLSNARDEAYAQFLLDMDPTEVAFMPAQSREHTGLKCGETERVPTTCTNQNDDTSVQREYNDFRRCKKGLISDSCTEFYVVWYTEKTFDNVDCEAGVGDLTKVSEHKDWRCYQ